ncbi:MAG TPA: hypothetical protein DCG75_02685 [Bacteroidales bacterium]|nr:hypothetical protein [Bacteroidales bacterium]
MKQVIRKRYTTEELLEILKKAHEKAKVLNIILSIRVFNEFCKENYGSMLIGSVINRFASVPGGKDGWGMALKQLGIEHGKTYNKDIVLEHIYQAYLDNDRKQPTEEQISSTGISLKTVYRYFGKTSSAIKAMYDAKEIKQDYVLPANVAAIRKLDKAGESLRHLHIDLDESPVNEQGVVLLFGKVHFAIGFPTIIKVQQDFPDCKAYSIIGGEYHRANIEFKFKSASYFRSRRSIKEWEERVNYLVCWEHNSKSFNEKIRTVQVIALKDELKKKEVLRKLKEHYSEKLEIFKQFA